MLMGVLSGSLRAAPVPVLPSLPGGEEKNEKPVAGEDTNAPPSIDNQDGNSRIRIRRNGNRRSRIVDRAALAERERQRKGTAIFGLGIIGFSGVWNQRSLEGASRAGQVDDASSGYGMGAVFSMNLAGGRLNSLGIRQSGKWYWRWGFHMNLDYTQNKIEKKVNGETLIEDFADVHLVTLVKHYFPMSEFSFSRRIVVLNRFEFFLGTGPKWTVNIKDRVENADTRQISAGPGVTDTFWSLATGFNIRLTEETWIHADFQYSFNLSPEIRSEFGREIKGAGTGGSDMVAHMGLAYRLE